MRWSDPLADSLASMNLYLDHSKAHRRAELDSLRAKLGACSPAKDWYFVAVYSASTDMETVIACGQLAPPVP